jgi:hypothetical protein
MEETTQQAVTDVSATSTETQATKTPEQIEAEKAASAVATQAEKDKTSQTPDDKGSEPEKESKAVKELKEQRRRRQDAERIAQEKIEEAAYLRGKLESQQTTTARTTAQAADGKPVEPKIEAFEDYNQFEAARGRYYIDAAKWEMRQEYTATVQKTATQQRDATFNSRMAEAIEKDPDFAEVATSPSFKSIVLSPIEFDVIRESEVGPKILFYLYNNPAEAAKIARLSPFTAAKEIGRIEDKILNPPKTETKKISDAPAPITTVKQERATVETDLTKVSMEEFARLRRQGKAAG